MLNPQRTRSAARITVSSTSVSQLPTPERSVSKVAQPWEEFRAAAFALHGCHTFRKKRRHSDEKREARSLWVSSGHDPGCKKTWLGGGR